MKAFVQTRGFAQHEEYRWYPSEPKNIAFSDILQLVDLGAPSVVLWRHEGNLHCMVSGLDARRVDFRDRPIENSLVVMGGPREGLDIQSIASEALRFPETLACLVRDNMDKEDVNGNGDPLVRPLRQVVLRKELVLNANDEMGVRKVAKDSEEKRVHLASLIETTRLPTVDGPLLLCTDHKPEKVLVDAGVWRGLSTLIEASGWKIVGEKPRRKTRGIGLLRRRF